ncbi:hypothetical protein EV567_5291 [Streptomyces sp. BK239]|nr:hypothetical protein EV567_5291 [Streptomyces sp. BK239]
MRSRASGTAARREAAGIERAGAPLTQPNAGTATGSKRDREPSAQPSVGTAAGSECGPRASGTAARREAAGIERAGRPQGDRPVARRTQPNAGTAAGSKCDREPPVQATQGQPPETSVTRNRLTHVRHNRTRGRRPGASVTGAVGAAAEGPMGSRTQGRRPGAERNRGPPVQPNVREAAERCGRGPRRSRTQGRQPESKRDRVPPHTAHTDGRREPAWPGAVRTAERRGGGREQVAAGSRWHSRTMGQPPGAVGVERVREGGRSRWAREAAGSVRGRPGPWRSGGTAGALRRLVVTSAPGGAPRRMIAGRRPFCALVQVGGGCVPEASRPRAPGGRGGAPPRSDRGQAAVRRSGPGRRRLRARGVEPSCPGSRGGAPRRMIAGRRPFGALVQAVGGCVPEASSPRAPAAGAEHPVA